MPHPDSSLLASERQRERERELERRYHSRGGYDRGLGGGYGVENTQVAIYSRPEPFQNSLTSIAPGYNAYGNPHSSSGALARSNVIEEQVVEHEHHHVHHHIDHGMAISYHSNKNPGNEDGRYDTDICWRGR